ncbi:MAG: hypothetical protein OEV40_11610 [Acidimicrobiia bacterium]|nr:hypothetical protein [Acidimicrobiia bacterium]
MVGTAERAITQRHRAIVAELRAMAEWPRPPYPSSSGFRSVYDRLASRDIADTSALAQQLGVLIRSMTEQELRSPVGPEPGTVQPEERRSVPDPLESLLAPSPRAERAPAGESQPPPPTGPRLQPGSAPGPTTLRLEDREVTLPRLFGRRRRSRRLADPQARLPAPVSTTEEAPEATPTGSGASIAGAVRSTEGSGAVAVVPPSSEALLSVPATVAARERAELGCRALAKSWYREAEKFFLAGVELTPTDPFVWFGAGLAASGLDATRAAQHLVQSSRYLTIDDPAAAAYVAILSAALLESAGDGPGARQVLRSRLDELNVVCPAISLHLARLGADRSYRLAEAISSDPMLDADLLALGLEASGDVIKQRRQRTEQELGQVDYSIAELRQINSQRAGADPDGDGAANGAPSNGGAGSTERLSLARIEVQLWRRIRACETEIDIARRVVEQRERVRREKEAELAQKVAIAEEDLVSGTTIPYFGLSLLIAVGIVVSYVVGRTFAATYPVLAIPIAVLTWLVVLGLVTWAVMGFVQAWWPHRRFAAARSVKRMLPTLEWEASKLREEEFMIRRRFRAASQAAELRISRIVDRRSVLVPRRPVFLATDLPLVTARGQDHPEPES